MKNTEQIWDLVDAKRERFLALSDRVWGMPELAYSEFRSVAEHTAMLKEQGFQVTENYCGIPTAVMGEAGEGGPVIAILGEYDALPGLSQEAGIAEHRPLPGNGNGHGCGHNMLGSAALLAATALKDYLAATGQPGRVRYYGCPAEEGGAAKGVHGAGRRVRGRRHRHHLAPGRDDQRRRSAVAGQYADGFHLHRPRRPCRRRAASGPQRARCGRADECRRQLSARACARRQPHPLRASSTPAASRRTWCRPRRPCAMRCASRDVAGMQALNERVKKIAEGAALMTETQVDIRVISAVSNLLGNTPLEEAMYQNLQRLGPVPFDAADRDFAAKIQATLSEEDIEASYARAGVERERRARRSAISSCRWR